jgi:hypothetical protein
MPSNLISANAEKIYPLHLALADVKMLADRHLGSRRKKEASCHAPTGRPYGPSRKIGQVQQVHVEYVQDWPTAPVDPTFKGRSGGATRNRWAVSRSSPIPMGRTASGPSAGSILGVIAVI